MKDAFWLRHDSNAQHDERILELRAEFGWEGYGLFWALVERMRDAQDYRLAMATMGGLATSMGLLKPKMLAVVELCCTHGLFAMEEAGGYVYSPSLRRRMEEWDTKKAAFAEAGKRGQAAKQARKAEATLADEASQAEATLKPPLSHPDENLSREEKSRIEEIKQEEPLPSVEDAASAAAPVEEESQPVELPFESPTPGLRTPGGPADVATRKPAKAKPALVALTGDLAALLNPGGLADRVQAMKQPFTQFEADALVTKYGTTAAQQIVKEMANYAKLTNNVSANLTAQKWLDKRRADSSTTTYNPQAHAVYPRNTSPAARAQYVPDVDSYGSL